MIHFPKLSLALTVIACSLAGSPVDQIDDERKIVDIDIQRASHTNMIWTRAHAANAGLGMWRCVHAWDISASVQSEATLMRKSGLRPTVSSLGRHFAPVVKLGFSPHQGQYQLAGTHRLLKYHVENT